MNSPADLLNDIPRDQLIAVTGGDGPSGDPLPPEYYPLYKIPSYARWAVELVKTPLFGPPGRRR